MLSWEKPLALIDVNVDRKHYNYCFGCGTDNPLGLKLAFQWDGKTARASFLPTKEHQGWPDTVHGGLIMAVLDEAIGWAAYFQGIKGVTGKIEVRLKKPIPIGQAIGVSGACTKASRKLVQAKSAITLGDGSIAAEAAATIYIVPQNDAGRT